MTYSVDMKSRRQFLAGIGAAGAVSMMPAALVAEPTSQDFDFLFFTDTHLQPELDAAHGCAMAFKKMHGMKVDFAMQGGDHVFDSLAVPKSRSMSLFDLYDKTQQDVGMKIYHALGNHDCVGVFKASGMEPADPAYGKKYFQDHIGKTFYSFDHKGVHFIVLDTIGLTADRNYEGRVDAEQLAWLKEELAGLSPTQPVLVMTHIPLVSAIGQYTPTPPKPGGLTVINANEVLPLFSGRNIIGVLQGHTHINEMVLWQGVPYITSGAVSGNWWKGTRLGTPEGFTVVSIRNGKMETRYETYGFKSVAPENT